MSGRCVSYEGVIVDIRMVVRWSVKCIVSCEGA